MSYVLFQDILDELGHKLNYDAIINYAGNGFVQKSWDMIMDANPMNISNDGHMSNRSAQTFADFLSKARVVTKGSPDIPRAPIQRKE